MSEARGLERKCACFCVVTHLLFSLHLEHALQTCSSRRGLTALALFWVRHGWEGKSEKCGGNLGCCLGCEKGRQASEGDTPNTLKLQRQAMELQVSAQPRPALSAHVKSQVIKAIVGIVGGSEGQTWRLYRCRYELATKRRWLGLEFWVYVVG